MRTGGLTSLLLHPSGTINVDGTKLLWALLTTKDELPVFHKEVYYVVQCPSGIGVYWEHVLCQDPAILSFSLGSDLSATNWGE